MSLPITPEQKDILEKLAIRELIFKEAEESLATFCSTVNPLAYLLHLARQLADLPKFAVQWRAYTPSFNDGDPCVFSVYSEYTYSDEKVVTEADTEWLEITPDIMAMTTGQLLNSSVTGYAKGLRTQATLLELLNITSVNELPNEYPRGGTDYVFERIIGNGIRVYLAKNGDRWFVTWEDYYE